LSALPLEGRLLLVAQAALRRLEHDRDLNRLVCRDLAQFPDLLTKVRDQEIVRHSKRSRPGCGTSPKPSPATTSTGMASPQIVIRQVMRDSSPPPDLRHPP
jgi:hypothetical protein